MTNRPHEEHQKTHRSPRVLIVANKLDELKEGAGIARLTHHMASELGCYCMKFCSDAPNNVHVLIPAKYDSTLEQILQNVLYQAASAGQSYDMIIVDSEKCGEELKRITSKFNTKPAMLIFTEDEKSALSLQKRGIPAFNTRNLLPDGDYQCAYDEQVTLALGEDGIKRLEAQAGEKNAYDQWSDGNMKPKEVAPAGVARTETKFAGESRV